MDNYRRRQVQAAQKTKKIDPFKPGSKKLKPGFKRLGDGMIEEVETGRKAQF